MRLKYQLFLTLLLFSTALIALLAVFNSWSFDRGFTRYVVENEKQRLQPVATMIAEHYRRQQSWDWIENQPTLMRQILNNELRDSRVREPQEQLRAPPPGRPKQRLVLIDQNRNLLVGREVPSKNVVWQPIVLDGQEIAYLGIREPRGLPGELEEAFVQQQLDSYGYTAIATVVLSALMAFALAPRIVRPILNVNTAVGHITGGEYQHRIASNRKDELGDVARNINQMAFTLEKNQSARQQWMAEISHELRTPVAILQGELEAIQDGIKEASPEAIDSLHAESVRLSLLIDDLHELTLSDVGALNYTMAPVDLAAILEQRLNTSESTLFQAELTVSKSTPQDPVMVLGDSQRLSQLIDNLLQNSVRYTNRGGKLDIRLSTTTEAVELVWSDSAPGVTDEQIPNLFNLLYRTEAFRNREFGGSGLGLAIAKKIVLAHQGSISAFHSDTGGLAIRVQLPAKTT